jgi:membrane fusion protein (multidrug efflux system)
LLSLLQSEQAARVEGAVATLNEARNVVKRMKPLLDDGGVSLMAYEEAKKDVLVAESNLAALRVQQKERILVAPFDGLLGFRRVSKGAYLSPGQVVTTLVDDSVMKLDFDVPSLEVSQLKPGVKVRALTDDFPDRVFEGEITSVENTIDPVTRSVTVRAIIPNDDLILRAGTFMSVIVEAAPSQGLSVPEEAIQPRGPNSYVFVIEDDGGTKRARRLEVEPGRREGKFIEITSGLSEGDLVITEGVIRVREGSEVKIQDPAMLLPSKDGPAAPPKRDRMSVK